MKKFIFALFLISFNIPAIETYFCSSPLENMPIQQNGRVKPLFVHATESLKELTQHRVYENLNAFETYCLLSVKGFGLNSGIKLEANVEHVKLKQFLNFKENQKTMAYEDLLSLEDSIKMEMRMTKENDSYKKAVKKLYNQIGLYKDITTGQNWMLAEIINNQIEWQPISQFLTEEKVKNEEKNFSSNPFFTALKKSETNYYQLHPEAKSKIDVEAVYAKSNLVSWALTITLLGLFVVVGFKNKKYASYFIILTSIVQIVLIGFRVYISGRAPITNMYETVLSSGTGGVILATFLYFYTKDSIYIFVGLAYNVCALLMLNFANGMLSATISPLVPVLRDNFWLSTHVTTVILSYGALALSWILANYVLYLKITNKLEEKVKNYYAEKIYTILKFGTVLLALGIILGGVWADYSWGRFWGWDPKETWSLIVFCIYMAILHGRYTNWIKNDQFFAFTSAAFLSVMMAWFGVNYILATGLHSYGFSEGGALFLGTFFSLQIIFLIIAKFKAPLPKLG